MHVPIIPEMPVCSWLCTSTHPTIFRYAHAYPGHDIKGEYPVEELLEQLHSKKITAVVGRVEFVPVLAIPDSC